ncbi:MAG: excinuclease ABC subunit UvrB [bacterium]|nr:excinuclease ABC subunit UvrB [bacterium]MDZ4284717.1 excinuclease ABC subunit UvrB [Patescibacteria group bacterium]
MGHFSLKSSYTPAGDQPQAILALLAGLESGEVHQTLLGATGTGKTFTMANVIAAFDKPALVIAHNKTLAAQLAQEYRSFFPENAVHYFVSYYDFYQPEAYLPVTDTYIEKEAMVNEEIDRLRHAATQALLTRRDVIIVASVSCIYGLGSPTEYEKVHLRLSRGASLGRAALMRQLVRIYFERTNTDLTPGTFRAVGNAVEVMPAHEEIIFRIEFDAESIAGIRVIDALTRAVREPDVADIFIFPAKHYVTPESERERAMADITHELAERLAYLESRGMILERERLKRRTNYDLAMIREVGYCNGIENYSRHFDGRSAGEPPFTLLDYFPHQSDGTADFLTVIDESHVTVPQIGGMFAGDSSRKETLVEHGFRLPSAKDNRPLTFEEFDKRVGQRIYTSATPAVYEREHSVRIVEQIIRPTGLVDPEVTVRPIVSTGDYSGQIADFIVEAERAIHNGGRVIATTLTKKMAEDLSTYLKEHKLKAEYLHSGIKTIERIEILTNFRRGVFDVIVGVNLLREGLDLPEVELIGILDADKEGFLRSDTALIQIIGRAARNVNGRVILYADRLTGSIERALDETNRRREKQLAHNKEHGITPRSITKAIHDIAEEIKGEHTRTVEILLALEQSGSGKTRAVLLREKKKQMSAAVKELDFETAAILRDEIRALERLRK